MKQALIFRQLFEHDSSTYTYLLADPETLEGIIIDPVIETLERDLKMIRELGIRLKYTVDTHVHADHITAANKIKEYTQAQTAIGKHTGVEHADIYLADGEPLKMGGLELTTLYTPGHTKGCSSYLISGNVFTGDALFVRGCGRTDFQDGSSKKLYQSVHEKLFKLPDDTFVYPAHDYRGNTVSTIGEEKKFNPRLGDKISEDEFIKIMGALKLANPKKIMEAVPANLLCGNRSNSD